jgi:hypothetical protein
MTSQQYVIIAYAAGLGLLWGYAVLMWLEARRVRVNANEGTERSRS